MSEKKQLLIADDDDDFRELLKMYLVSKGFDVITASDGVEALEAVAANKVDLMLLDLNMPRKDGFQVASELTETLGTAAPPILIVTGRSLVEEDVAVLLSGAVGALHKPFRMDDLLTRVHRALEGGDSPWDKIQGSPGSSSKNPS